MKKSRKPYREGKMHVLARRCDSCIFRPGNRMHLDKGRRDRMVAEATRNNSAIFCHETLDGLQAVCHGFWQKHKTGALQLAERLGIIAFQKP